MLRENLYFVVAEANINRKNIFCRGSRIDPCTNHALRIEKTFKVSLWIFGIARATAMNSRCPQGGGRDVAV
jgi:hypothetical protein